jgi:hypothetical protein
MHPLVVRLSEPQAALRILLTDIFPRSPEIKSSDRNGLILTSLLLVGDSRQKSCNIELTPVEVLKVGEGLNREMVEVAKDFVEQNRGSVINKFRAITETLLKVSAGKEPGASESAPRYLLYLQREMIIFLALTGGELSLSIVQGVVRDFGNPDSTYYQTLANKENLRYSLQLLQVAVRCLRRLEDPQEKAQIDLIVSRVRDFTLLCEDSAQQVFLKKVIENIRLAD